MLLYWYLWMFKAFIGGLFGMMTLHALDNGLWDDAMLKGAMAPPPTAEERFKFMFVCILVPELPMAGLLWAYLNRGKER